ncbi:molybdopterin converting factor small subunit [Ochrobactrum daejeonense]|uniref:Molybdopterin converting factor small subunit n=1 Tax=Brucella daejeonensis TaxID=659015 RepID=A0A7W9AZT8_9HYPH|nr:MoaD/ThiS family protein [Brucella daejeonensis]MBB5703640.1 molybdopterin converting factor small subunit [Brucella daejeonensis]NKB79909.1 MoaD/ThiS family protein [Brucella daejeonensis]
MPKVNLWTGLRQLADGNEVVEVDAGNVGEMLDALVNLHPRLAPAVKAGLSVVVDGEVSVSRFAPVTADSEIYLLQQLKGG